MAYGDSGAAAAYDDSRSRISSMQSDIQANAVRLIVAPDFQIFLQKLSDQIKKKFQLTNLSMLTAKKFEELINIIVDFSLYDGPAVAQGTSLVQSQVKLIDQQQMILQAHFSRVRSFSLGITSAGKQSRQTAREKRNFLQILINQLDKLKNFLQTGELLQGKFLQLILYYFECRKNLTEALSEVAAVVGHKKITGKEESTTLSQARTAIDEVFSPILNMIHTQLGKTQNQELNRPKIFTELYDLWFYANYSTKSGLVPVETLRKILEVERLLETHFSADTPTRMTELLVNNKYQTLGPLIIDFDASFPGTDVRKLQMGFIGCFGVNGAPIKTMGREFAGQAQDHKAVATALNKEELSIIFNLGDGVYDNGPQEPANIDYQMSSLNLEEKFMLLGNHDYDLSSQALKHFNGRVTGQCEIDRPLGLQRGLLYVCATYLGKGRALSGAEKEAAAAQTLQSSNYHTPYRYYALVLNQARELIIVLDSNLFAFDEYQQKWFYDLLQLPPYKNYRKTLLMHHPFIDPSKRGLVRPKHKNEIAKYWQLIQGWFEKFSPLRVNPVLEPRMWNYRNQASTLIDITRYLTMGQFIADFIVQNNLVMNFDKAIVLGAHFHGHAEYSFVLKGLQGERANLMNYILGGGGAPLGEIKSINTAGEPPFKPIDEEVWAQYGITNVEFEGVGAILGYAIAKFEPERHSVETICLTAVGRAVPPSIQRPTHSRRKRVS